MKQLKILFIDNKILKHKLDTLIGILEKIGYDVNLTICNKSCDIHQYKEDKFDISFVDYMLIRDKLNSITSSKICITSSSDDSSIPKFALNNKLNFLYKPFNIEKMVNMITSN